MFADINWRTLKEHPIETVLIDDLLKLLGRERVVKKMNQIQDDNLLSLPDKEFEPFKENNKYGFKIKNDIFFHINTIFMI